MILNKFQQKAVVLFSSQRKRDFARCVKRKVHFIAGNIATKSTPLLVLNAPMIPSSKHILLEIKEFSFSTINPNKVHAHLAKCNSRPRENPMCYSTDINIPLDDSQNIELLSRLSWQEIHETLVKSKVIPQTLQLALLPENMNNGKASRHKIQNVNHFRIKFLIKKPQHL